MNKTIPMLLALFGGAEQEAAGGAANNPIADHAPGQDAQARKEEENGADAQKEQEKMQLLAEKMREVYGMPKANAHQLENAFFEDKKTVGALYGKLEKGLAFRGAMKEYCALLKKADELRQRYRGFDLEALCRDKRFIALIGAGADMEEAYQSLHQREMLRMAVEKTAQLVGARMSAGLAAQKNRPREGAMQATGAVRTKASPANMSKAQREAIAKRVLGGERIIL